MELIIPKICSVIKKPIINFGYFKKNGIFGGFYAVIV